MNYFKVFNSFKPFLRLFTRIWPYLKAGGPALFLVFFILVHIAIWMYGPQMEIDQEFPLKSITIRLSISMLFTLLCIVVIGFYQKKEMNEYYRQKKTDELLETDITVRYIERQEFELNHMMKHIKDNFREKNYLYKLPWYLIVGLDSSGKTSLINRSGQNFLFSSALKASKMVSENPVSFKWWLSDTAILIDPDGPIFSQAPAKRRTEAEQEAAIKNNTIDPNILGPTDKDPEICRHLWIHFLTWIGKIRAQRPLNGLIFAVDVSYLANANVHNRKVYASTLRGRMRDIMESLASRLPVYIVLTKLDLLNGFSTFFKNFTKNEREEVFGFTFSLNSYDTPDAWLAEFEIEFTSFMKRINDILPKLLMQTADKVERHEIYSFTRQLAGLSDILQLFLKEALVSDKFSTAPIVRGLYLTSVYQQGVPDDVFVNAAAKRYQLEPMLTAVQSNQNSIPFFTYQLFDKIILKESGLATDNLHLQAQNRRKLMTTGIFGSIISLMSIFIFNYFYTKNSHAVENVRKDVATFSKISIQNTVDPTGKLLEKPLTLIRSATLEFGLFHNRLKYLSDAGLYLGHKVGPEVEATYLQLLGYRYLPSLISGVAKNLEEAPANSDEQLELLRVFRMLVDKKARMPEFVTDYFRKFWQQSFEGDRPLQESLMRHLEYALEHTDINYDRSIKLRKAENALAPYDNLILKAQTELSVMPMEQRVYRSLKQHGLAMLGAPLDLRIEVGPAFDLIFDIPTIQEKDIKVPILFTKNGLEKYYLIRSENISELAMVDNWVIGKRNNIDFSEEDKIKLREKLREQYTSDYENYWRTALNAINIKNFQDINHGILILDNIINVAQPFQRLLASVKGNTKLFPTMPEDDKARVEMTKSTVFMIASQVDLSFTNLNELTKIMANASTSKPNFMEEVLLAIRNLHSQLKYIQGSQDVGQVALKVAKDRLQLTDADPIFALKRIAERLPQPMDRLVNKLADEAWHVILLESIKEIDRHWKEIVVHEFNSVLANKFPFNPKSNVDVSLEEFEHFFGEKGTISQFYDAELKLFLNESLFRNKAGDTYSTLILPQVISQLETSQKIRRAFFNQRGVLGVEFTLAPLSMGPQMRRSLLNIEGQYVEYTHGPRKGSALIWPNSVNNGDETIAKLTLISSKSNQPQDVITYKGPWALFRMLNQAKITSLETNKLNINFILNGVGMKYELVPQGEINPFTASLLQSFKLSPSLYK